MANVIQPQSQQSVMRLHDHPGDTEASFTASYATAMPTIAQTQHSGWLEA